MIKTTKTLWRAAADDDVTTGASFAASRDVAETYRANPGFGGHCLYRTVVEIRESQVIDLTSVSVAQVAQMVGMSDPGAIGVDEWLPRTQRALDAPPRRLIRRRRFFVTNSHSNAQ